MIRPDKKKDLIVDNIYTMGFDNFNEFFSVYQILRDAAGLPKIDGRVYYFPDQIAENEENRKAAALRAVECMDLLREAWFDDMRRNRQRHGEINAENTERNGGER